MPTGIYEIHGPYVPQNELADRGRMVSGSVPYIPYNNLTKGEMKLSLLLEQANMYAAAYPERKEFKESANMLSTALRQGLANGINFVGALYDPLLQLTAREIQKAVRQTAPAAGILLGRDSIAKGLQGIGEPIVLPFDHDCVQYATKKANEKFKQLYPNGRSWQQWENQINNSVPREYYREQKQVCRVKIEIEKIVNQRITDASHHVLYYDISQGFPGTKFSFVKTKMLLQLGGIAGLANATETDTSLMSTWSETSILRKNSISNVGTVGSVQSSFYLAPDPQEYMESYIKWKESGAFSRLKSQKTRGGSKIGLDPATITALVVAITGAIKAAADMQRSMNEKKAGAMGSALNYGTPALEALKEDFDVQGGSGESSNLPLLAAAGLAAYLLLK